MRKFLQKLLDRSECVLATGQSFLFVTNFEKRRYKELFCESVFQEKSLGIKVSDIVFDSEWAEIKALIKEGRVIFDYDYRWDDAEGCEEIRYKIAKKEAIENELFSKSSEEKFVFLYKKLDGESQMIILRLCEMLASRDGEDNKI